MNTLIATLLFGFSTWLVAAGTISSLGESTIPSIFVGVVSRSRAVGNEIRNGDLNGPEEHAHLLGVSSNRGADDGLLPVCILSAHPQDAAFVLHRALIRGRTSMPAGHAAFRFDLPRTSEIDPAC